MTSQRRWPTNRARAGSSCRIAIWSIRRNPTGAQWALEAEAGQPVAMLWVDRRRLGRDTPGRGSCVVQRMRMIPPPAWMVRQVETWKLPVLQAHLRWQRPALRQAAERVRRSLPVLAVAPLMLVAVAELRKPHWASRRPVRDRRHQRVQLLGCCATPTWLGASQSWDWARIGSVFARGLLNPLKRR